jgi:hypothetical protein
MINKSYKNTLFLLPLILILFSFNLNNQKYFEGTIKYRYDFVIKNDKISIDRLKDFFGTSIEFYFKEGNFLEKYNKGVLKEQLYRMKDHRLYFRNATSDTVNYSNTLLSGKKILNTEINLEKDTILGIVCHELVIDYDDYKFTLYFNRDYAIDPDWYLDYKRNGRDVYSKIIKSIYLKFKLEYKDFILVGTATEINRKKLDDSVFDLKKQEVLIEKAELK